MGFPHRNTFRIGHSALGGIGAFCKAPHGEAPYCGCAAPVESQATPPEPPRELLVQQALFDFHFFSPGCQK